MKRLIALMLFATLAGCVSPSGWYRANVSQSRANNDLTNCQVKATQNVGTNIQTQATGGYFVGYVFIPTFSNVDVNTTLRSKVVAQCMTGRGYQTVELPLCPSRVAIPEMSRPAKLTENSCFKSIEGGYYAIAQK